MSNYNLRDIKLGLVPKVEKVRKPPPKMSAKMKKEKPAYRKIVAATAKEDDRCKIKSPVCTGKMEGMNHKQKRSPKNRMVEKNLTASCNACNGYLETHLDWAKANGHFISRFAKTA